jgi:hypothetical protein
MTTRRACFVLFLGLLVPLAGCGGSAPVKGGVQLIHSAADGSRYLDDVIRGAGLTAKLADDASLEARLAVAKAEDVAAIRRIHDTDSSESESAWVCDAIGVVSDSSDFVTPAPGLDEIVAQIQQDQGAAIPEEDTDTFVDALRQLPGSDAVKLGDALCDSGF